MSELHSDHECCAHHSQHHELVVESLSVGYRQVSALKDISFSTSCGNRVALIGPNGAGKSTLLKTIAGLTKYTKGSLSWRGSRITKWSREFAYLPQREEVDWNFPITVRGLVEMGRYPQTGMFSRFSKVDHAAVDQTLEHLELTDLSERQIRELSGGQQQRAFLGRAICQEAHVLLLDEPFTGLDRTAATMLEKTILSLAEEGRLIIASHHDLSNASEIFNQTLLLNQRGYGFGPTEELLTEPNIESCFNA